MVCSNYFARGNNNSSRIFFPEESDDSYDSSFDFSESESDSEDDESEDYSYNDSNFDVSMDTSQQDCVASSSQYKGPSLKMNTNLLSQNRSKPYDLKKNEQWFL